MLLFPFHFPVTSVFHLLPCTKPTYGVILRHVVLTHTYNNYLGIKAKTVDMIVMIVIRLKLIINMPVFFSHFVNQ